MSVYGGSSRRRCDRSSPGKLRPKNRPKKRAAAIKKQKNVHMMAESLMVELALRWC